MVWTFGNDSADGTIAKCVLTNYSQTPILTAYVAFQTDFNAVVKTPMGVGSGTVISSREIFAPLLSLGAYTSPSNQDFFYIWNPTAYYAMISVPSAINIEVPGTKNLQKVALIQSPNDATAFGLSCTPKSGFFVHQNPSYISGCSRKLRSRLRSPHRPQTTRFQRRVPLRPLDRSNKQPARDWT